MIFRKPKSEPNIWRDILSKDIKWFDYSLLDYAQRKTYYDKAQEILTNPTFNNEYNTFLEEIIKHSVLESRNFKEVMALRTSVEMLKAFIERFENIQDPQKEISKDDLDSAI